MYDNTIDELDQHFAQPCAAHFEFLASEHGFTMACLGAGNESVIAYREGELLIQIRYPIPELPSLTAQVVADGKLLRQQIMTVEMSPEVTALVKAFERHRAQKTPGVWWREYKRGKFDATIDAVLAELARLLKPRLEQVRQRDFSVLK